MTEISVVIPVYRAAPCIPALHARLTAVLGSMGVDYELVLVEDRGGDGTWELLEELAEHDRHVRAFQLSRNFGQEAATSAGLSLARGTWTVVMDCDLQDPPESIPAMYERAQEGFDLVRARRDKRGSWYRRTGNRVYFWLLNRITGVDWGGDEYGAFSIFSEKVRRAYLSIQDSDRNFLMIMHWLGFDSADVDVPHEDRLAGESAYTLRSLIRYAFNGMFFETTAPLRWVIYLGFMVSTLGFLASAYLVVQRVNSEVYPGWTSVVVLLLILSGFIITSTGIAGLYIGKVFEQAKGRPLYILDKATSSSDSAVVGQRR